MIIPMFFTCARILIAPFLFQAIAYQSWRCAFLLFCIGAFTDFLDGFAARYLHQESFLGAALDPVADKIFVMTALYALSLQVSYIPYYVVIGIVAKEIVLMIGAASMLYSIPGCKIEPVWHAKLLTAFSCAALCLMIACQMQVWDISDMALAWIMNLCLLGNVYVLVEYSFKMFATYKEYHAR